MSKEVTIKIGEAGESWLQRYPQYAKVTKQPAGLDFYEIDLDDRPRGTVKVDHGKHTFSIANVLSVMGTYDTELPLEGLSQISIGAGITDPDLIPHDEARLKTYALLKKIEQAGWKIITSRSRPRLTGKDRLNYALNVSNSVALDLNYIPTLEEWMRIEDLTEWRFYADGQFLEVYFKRERTLLDPAKPGSYLLTLTLQSETEHFRGYVESEDRQHWKTLFLAQLEKLKPVRTKAEAALKAQGITIDETYQDPPLPDLK